MDNKWREYDIYDDTVDDDNEQEEDNKDFLFDLFEKNSKEVLELHFPKLPTIFLEAQQDYTNSTGLALWGGSEVLCHHLAENPTLIRGKTVLELGAGLGLCGIAAHHLGASQVLLTDGDTRVLATLRENVNRNISSSSTIASDDAGTSSSGSKGKELSSSSTTTACCCPQLIWGRNLDSFVQENGQQNVIIGSDIVYMVPSVEPLWQTVHKLLDTTGIFLWVQLAASTAPLEMVLETATKYGFTWTTSNATSSSNAVVYMFQRQKKS